MIKTLFFLFLSTYHLAFSTVRLSGVVTNTESTPLEDVVISLKKEYSVHTITTSDGKFLLEADYTPIQLITSPEQLPLKFNLKGSTIVFSSLSECISGIIELFSSNGKRIFSSSFTNLEPLVQKVIPCPLATGLHFIRICVNGKTYTFQIILTGKNLLVKNFHLNNSSMNTPSNFSFAKASSGSSFIDTIIAIKTGYFEKKTPITNYVDSNLLITMESNGVCTPPEAGTSKTNPIFTDVYTADPACMVDSCIFYITCGHDQGTGGFDLREWYLLKSTDMANWTRTTPMTLETFSWTNANAWAGQMIKGLNGKYYWYVPINDIVYSKDRMAIGVAVADNPEGPWKDALGKPLINDSLEMSTWGITNIDQTPHTIDPTVFIDDDGQAYLQYGGFWTMVTVKLNPDMISLSGKLVKTTPSNYFESPYLIKRNDIYYEIYAAGSANPTTIDYATSNSPMGPWTHKGTILPKMTKVSGQDEPTNHAGVAEFAGQWYIVYHISNGPNDGGTYRRMVAIDKLDFNDDGSINPVTPGSVLSF